MTATTLPGVLLSGTHSGRPAASAVANGTLYAETDTGQTYQSDGASTWTAWGAVVAAALTVKDEGTPLATAATSLDFVGAGVTASGTGAGKTITIPGAGAALASGYAAVATDESTASAAYTDLTTPGPAVTLTVNTKVKVTLSALIYSTTDGGSMGVAISGANTIAASQAQSLIDFVPAGMGATRVCYFSGLTPGSTTFTAKYARLVGGTADFLYREILVECMD